jgi:mRNA interferase YafQ
MRKVQFTKQFQKDTKRAKKAGKNMGKLKTLILLITSEKELPAKNKNHKLIGNFIDSMECHVEPDWLLIYKITPQYFIFERTGSHSQLFVFILDVMVIPYFWRRKHRYGYQKLRLLLA